MHACSFSLPLTGPLKNFEVLKLHNNCQFPMISVLGNIIDHSTVVCSVTWPLNGSKAGGDLVSIQTSLLLLCKSSCSDAN